MKEITIPVLAFITVCLLGYGGWQLKRWFNWEYQYRESVEQVVREMVKEECLRVKQ